VSSRWKNQQLAANSSKRMKNGGAANWKNWKKLDNNGTQ
jgi:hypothetical protein